MKTIIELSHEEAKQFFLKQKSYCDIDLPEYFTFQLLLDKLSKSITARKLSDIWNKDPKFLIDINYEFFTNKDGKFAWRPLQLINPVIYIFLVREITEADNWNLIVKRFETFQENSQIKCCSIPIVSEEEKKSDKAETVSNWWSLIEQQSLEFALHYDCFLNTDISDCYNSIYTHTIPWALHGKDAIKNDLLKPRKERQNFIGNSIDTTIQKMQFAQTNGIPQGSTIMDFIAEMVLGYADMLLSEKIKDEGIKDYRILRYRDDYRIFTNLQEDAVNITKLLTEILIELNLRLNSNKTFISTDIIQDAIKPDKMYWLGAKKGEKTLQKTLLLIHSLAKKHPNSGSIIRALSDFQKRIYKKQNIEKENIKVLMSIVVDIAYKNPKTYPMATAILSKLLSLLNNNDAINDIIASIEKKFNKLPNVGHLQVWLQRLTLKICENKDYEEKLCKKVIDDNTVIWNIDWLNDNIKNVFAQHSIIDKTYIQNMEQIITPEEVQLFEY
ncbi:MAG: RNA-directed DNA polymerase [Prevotellaceae bacterium]|jgi:hypothetical protein|nr:RNA-directed DNA polymerase [Prevotellaceae bacterium]